MKPESYEYLHRIDSPEELKQLSLSELPLYCDELRRFIVESCARTPGHLASSLGAVELSVALHYVYDAPEDKIVWDVGHQAYAHKIITGRREQFHTLRKMGGISGFPRPSESPFDAFTAGHASNSVSAALGMATANKLEGNPAHVVAVIGDGAMSGGLAFEGLNNAGVSRSDLLVILNDNRISIDRGTGALREYLVGITTSARYNRFKTWVWTKFPPGSRVHGALKKTANALKHGVLQQSNLFESFGFRYFGPVDGHDVVSLVKILRDLREIGGPKLLHTLTVKGHGYAPAELDQPTWHAPGRFDPETGIRSQESGVRSQESANAGEKLGDETIRRLGDGANATHSFSGPQPPPWGPTDGFDEAGKPAALPHLRLMTHNSSLMTPSRWQDVFGETLLELARENPKIVAITPAMVSGSGLGAMVAEMPARTFDVGIAEGHAVTFAAGLAAAGLTPFCVIYSSFLQRAWDNVIHDVAIEGLGVVLAIDRGGLVGEDGATHHGVFDLAALLPVPRLVIASPSDPIEMRNMMYTASKAGVPFVIRYPRGPVPEVTDAGGEPVDWREVPFEEMEIGRGREISSPPAPLQGATKDFKEVPKDVAVLSFGPIASMVPEAVRLAAERGVGVAHYDLRFAKPLDEKLLHEVGTRFKRVITIEDGSLKGGVGAAVEEFFIRHDHPVRVTKLGVPDSFVPHGTPAELYRLCGLDTEAILSVING